jgi:hypothetical protein
MVAENGSEGVQKGFRKGSEGFKVQWFNGSKRGPEGLSEPFLNPF